jgi:hypothetical protein
MKSFSIMLFFLTLVSCHEAHHKCLNSAIRENKTRIVYVKDANTTNGTCEACSDQTVDEIQATSDTKYGYGDLFTGYKKYRYGSLISPKLHGDLSSNSLKFLTDQILYMILFVYIF